MADPALCWRLAQARHPSRPSYALDQMSNVVRGSPAWRPASLFPRSRRRARASPSVRAMLVRSPVRRAAAADSEGVEMKRLGSRAGLILVAVAASVVVLAA